MPIWKQLLIVFGGLTLAVALIPYILRGIKKVVSMLRLGPLVLYSLAAAISLIFTDWVKDNFNWVSIGFFVILGLIVLSWVITFFNDRSNKRMIVNQIKIIDQLGIPRSRIVIKDKIFYDTKRANR